MVLVGIFALLICACGSGIDESGPPAPSQGGTKNSERVASADEEIKANARSTDSFGRRGRFAATYNEDTGTLVIPGTVLVDSGELVAVDVGIFKALTRGENFNGSTRVSALRCKAPISC